MWKAFYFFLNCNFVWVNCSHWIKLQYHEDTEKRKVSCYILSLINYYSVLKTEKSGWRYGSAVNRAYYFLQNSHAGLPTAGKELQEFDTLLWPFTDTPICVQMHKHTHKHTLKIKIKKYFLKRKFPLLAIIN